jgi:hypothetical protein
MQGELPMETPNERPSPFPSTPIEALHPESIEHLVKNDTIVPAIVARAFTAAASGCAPAF